PARPLHRLPRRRPNSLPVGPLSDVARLQGDLVHEAPGPFLARLEGADDGVCRRLEVLRRVSVRRGVTAADVAAGAAEPQVDPAVAAREALLASLRRARVY